MRSQPLLRKLASLGGRSRVLALCLGIGALTGCVIVDGDSDYDDDRTTVIDNGTTTTDNPRLENIDTDVALDSKLGDGVGVFVEYYLGGRYRIWTTCDTNFSGVTCPFDIYTSVDTASIIDATTEENLEGYDSITVKPNQGTVDLHFETDGDYDAATIDVTPGAILRVEAYVDGQPDSRFVYWFGNGVLHEGAPTNPVDFSPSKP
jgi:hypothetical protein